MRTFAEHIAEFRSQLFDISERKRWERAVGRAWRRCQGRDLNWVRWGGERWRMTDEWRAWLDENKVRFGFRD